MDSIKIETNLKAEGYAVTHIGGRKENQDSCYYLETPLGLVVTVCDGMGGMNGGKKASSLAVTTILNTFKDASKDSDCKEIVIKAIKAANDAILDFAENNLDFGGMGTTTTVIVINDYSAILAHVGDSRIYQLRGCKKIFRTFDHSMVFDLVQRKVITEEQARLSEHSNVITRALGAKPTKDLVVDVVERPYKKGDRFILCTDGYWGMFPEKDFLSRVCRRRRVALLDMILDVTKKINDEGNAKGGGHDNMTAAFIDVNQNSIRRERRQLQCRIAIIIAVLLVIILVVGFLYFHKDLNVLKFFK